MATQSDGGIIEFDDYEEPLETEQETFADRIRAILSANRIYEPKTLIEYDKWLIKKSAHNGYRRYMMYTVDEYRLWYGGHYISIDEIQRCVGYLRNEGFTVDDISNGYEVRW